MVLCAFFFRKNASFYAETRLLVPHANAVRPYQLSLRLKQRIHKRSVYAKPVFFVSCANAVRPYQLSLRLKHRIQKRFGLCGNPAFSFARKRRAPEKKLAFYPEMWYASYML